MKIIEGSIWSPWYPLDRGKRVRNFGGEKLKDPLPASGGIYRVQARGDKILAYIGQSGNLRRRAQELHHAFDLNMPFTEPHKAAPAFWSWLQDYPDLVLEISVAQFESSDYWRQGIEDFAIAYHRWWHGRSPRWNYSRMPFGWEPSSSKKQGVRGGYVGVEMPYHHAGIPPITDLFEESNPLGTRWAGYDWSDWCPARGAAKGMGRTQGLYRLRKSDAEELYFIGYGLLAHALSEAGRSDPRMEFSSVSGIWEEHQMRELRADALALYLRQRNSLPLAQYGGDDKERELLLPRLQEKAWWFLALLDLPLLPMCEPVGI